MNDSYRIRAYMSGKFFSSPGPTRPIVDGQKSLDNAHFESYNLSCTNSSGKRTSTKLLASVRFKNFSILHIYSGASRVGAGSAVAGTASKFLINAGTV
jgi:hypothetical protein